MAAKNKELMEKLGIFNIIYAKTPNEEELYFADDERFTYMSFHIQSCPAMRPHLVTAEQVMNFWHPAHSFIEGSLQRGENVLVHCMAGAHRAGSTGVSFLMKQL